MLSKEQEHRLFNFRLILQYIREIEGIGNATLSKAMRVSASALVRMQRGDKEIDLAGWYDFCETFTLNTDSLQTGYLTTRGAPDPEEFRNKHWKGRPPQLTMGPSTRAHLDFFLIKTNYNFFLYEKYLSYLGYDPIYFVNVLNPGDISLTFELAAHLIRHKFMTSEEEVFQHGKFLVSEHPICHHFNTGIKSLPKGKERLESFVLNAPKYDQNMSREFLAIEDDHVTIRQGFYDHVKKEVIHNDDIQNWSPCFMYSCFRDLIGWDGAIEVLHPNSRYSRKNKYHEYTIWKDKSVNSLNALSLFS